MSRTSKLAYVVLGIALTAGWQMGSDIMISDAVAAEYGGHSQYLVVGSSGPGFASPEEAVMLLEGVIIPSLEHLGASEKVLAGGLPVGARAVAFIIEARRIPFRTPRRAIKSVANRIKTFFWSSTFF